MNVEIIPVQSQLSQLFQGTLTKKLKEQSDKKTLHLSLSLASLLFSPFTTAPFTNNLLQSSKCIKIIISPLLGAAQDESMEHSFLSLLKGLAPNVELVYLYSKQSLDDMEKKAVDLNDVWIMSLPSEVLVSLFNSISVPSTTKSLIVSVSCSSTIHAYNTAISSIPALKDLQVQFVSRSLSSTDKVKNVSLVDSASASRMYMSSLVGLDTGACISHALASLANDTVILQTDSIFAYASTLLNDDWLHLNNLVKLDGFGPKKSKYVIEDLQLPEATTIFMTDSVQKALDVMQTRDFSQLPVVSENRRVVGLVSTTSLLSLPSHALKETVGRHMFRFARGEKYRVVTVDTGLEEVEGLLEKTPAVFVTDEAGKFTLAVVTRSDLVKFYNSLQRH